MQRGSPNPEQRASLPLRQALARRNATPPRRAGTLTIFFAAISFITSISRSRSATNFLGRTYRQLMLKRDKLEFERGAAAKKKT
jgi:hypothetical protein